MQTHLPLQALALQALTPQAFAALGAPSLVYVKEIKADEVLAGVPAEQINEMELRPDQVLFAVHGADGARLAVLSDRESAYAVARANELSPVSVH